MLADYLDDGSGADLAPLARHPSRAVGLLLILGNHAS
jgi:hypothetical protein